MEPIVSVIITTFERAKYLSEAIESVLAQDIRDIELIIVNDAPGDTETENIILSYKNKDPRIKYVKNKKHLGSARSLNEGLRSANGRYIAILDDDDAWISHEKLSSQVKFLEDNKGYVLVGTNIIAVEAGSEKEISRSGYVLPDEIIRKTIFSANPFAHSSVVYGKDAALSLGGYDEDLERGKDYDLWLRLGKTGKMAVLPDFWVKYRIDISSRKNMIKVKKNDSKAKLAIMKKHAGEYPGFALPFLAEWARYFVFSMLYLG